MAIVDPMSDVFIPLRSTTDQLVVFPSTNTPDFDSEIDALLAKKKTKRNTEPLIETDPLLDETTVLLLDDASMAENTDSDALEDAKKEQHDWCPNADRCVSRQQSDQKCSDTHDEDC